MRELSSGLRWLILAGVILVTVALATATYQRRMVEREVERGLAAQLASECTLAASLLSQSGAATAVPADLGDRRLTVVAADGTVVLDSAADARRMENHSNRPEIIAAHRDGQGVARRSSATTGVDFLYAARLLPDGRVVRIAAPLTVEEGLVHRLVLPVVISTVVVVLGGGIALLAYTWRSRVRVADLISVSRAFATGDFARRANLGGDDAFARLGHELNALGGKLRDSQERVVAQRELLDGALGALREGVACIDALDRVVYANAAYRQFAAGGSEVVGHPYYRFLAADAVGIALTGLRDGRPVPLDSLRFEHRRRHLQAALAGGGEDIVVLVLHDRTELTRAESARRDFLSAVSHELKTPLTAIIGFTDTLLDGAIEDRGTALSMIQGVSRHANRLFELVRDVLTISRLEQGAWLVRPEAVDWPLLLAGVLDDHRAAASERGVALRFDGPSTLPGRADPELIRQLVGNLVSNAIRYNRPDGSVVVALDVCSEGRVQVTVRDTGIGIPPEHQERVFERFYRVDTHRSRAVGGTGLGLAIVKHLVEVLEGTVALESSSAGTVFTLDLPRQREDGVSGMRARIGG